MASYNIFFRPRDPPKGTREADALMRTRMNRNLNRRLKIFIDDGDWTNALEAIVKAQRHQKVNAVNGWHYALSVHAFLNNPAGPRESHFLAEIHEAIILGEITLNVPLFRALLLAYDRFSNPRDALKMFEIAREHGTLDLIGNRGSQQFINLAAGLNREGLWQNALDVLGRIPSTVTGPDEFHRRRTHAESHAIAGNWAPALHCIQDIERKVLEPPNTIDSEKELNCLRLSVAHAAAASARWNVSLQFLKECAEKSAERTDHQQLTAICAANLNHLHKSGHWQKVLELSCFLLKQIKVKGESTAREESVHASVLNSLQINGHWERALEYYMTECADCSFESKELRLAVSAVMVSAGRKDAARRVLGMVFEKSPQSESYKSTATAFHQAAPVYDLLGDTAHAHDGIQHAPRHIPMPLEPQRVAHRQRNPSDADALLEKPLSLRWTPKAPHIRKHLTPENGYFSNFSSGDFNETSPPPPTRYYDRVSGWSHWGRTGLPQHKNLQCKSMYNFAQTKEFAKIPEYKRSWKKHRHMRNLFRR